MKKITGLVLFLLLGAWSLNAMADGGSGKISRIFPNGDTVKFRLKDDSCNSVEANEYYQIDMVADPAANSSFAMLLAAGSTGREVSVELVGDCSQVGNKEVEYIFQDF